MSISTYFRYDLRMPSDEITHTKKKGEGGEGDNKMSILIHNFKGENSVAEVDDYDVSRTVVYWGSSNS